MSPQDEREAEADPYAMLRTVVDQVGVGPLMVEVSTLRRLLDIERQARTTALRQPGAEYRRGLLEAADRFEKRVQEGYDPPASRVDQCEHGQFGWEDCIACYDQVLLTEIEAIRLLPESTKGGGR